MLGRDHIGMKDITMYFKNPDGTLTKAGTVETIVAYSGEGKSRLESFKTMYGGSISCEKIEFNLTELGKKVQELGFKEQDAWTISTFYGEEGYKNIKKLVKMGFSPRAAFNIHRTKGASWKEGKNGR
ncbi:hypothetical protein [Bacillus phage BC-T25]|nr:hypothetical protein [Bacillus phage BC-T25]